MVLFPLSNYNKMRFISLELIRRRVAEWMEFLGRRPKAVISRTGLWGWLSEAHLGRQALGSVPSTVNNKVK